MASSDFYERGHVLSLYWESDNTGAEKDSDLFIGTLSQLNSDTVSRALSDKDWDVPLTSEITQHAHLELNLSPTFYFFTLCGLCQES